MHAHMIVRTGMMASSTLTAAQPLAARTYDLENDNASALHDIKAPSEVWHMNTAKRNQTVPDGKASPVLWMKGEHKTAARA